MSLKRLYFVDKNGVEHFVIQNADIKFLHKACFEDIEKRKLSRTSHIRQWIENEKLWIDFGSWSEFYYIDNVTVEDIVT